jgi:hypothetical protein
VFLEEFEMPWLLGRNRSNTTRVFDPDPGRIDGMPARPYRVLHANLSFYSDPECSLKIEGAYLIVLKSEDPKQQQQVQECMPTRKKYEVGQLVEWDLNNKKVWQSCWYKNPETSAVEIAWTQAVEFIGKIVSEPQDNPPQAV